MEFKEGYIIAEEDYKISVLEKMNTIGNYTFLSYSTLLSNIYGSVDKKGVFLLMKEYGMDFDLAMEYIKYIPYVNEDFYNDAKLDSIASARHLLLKKGLFHKNEFFQNRVKRFPVTFTKEERGTLFSNTVNYLKNLTDVYVLKEENKTYSHTVYEYKNQEEEVYSLCNEILTLHKKGIPYSKIHVVNCTDSYLFLLKRMSNVYKIPFAFQADSNILHTEFAKSVLSLMKEKNTFSEVLVNSPESVFKKDFIRILTDYEITEESPRDYISFMEYSFKHMKYPVNLYPDSVILSDGFIQEDDYVFLLGLNQGSLPKTGRDDGYLKDDLLKRLGLPTSMDKNREEKEKLIHLLTSVKNLYVSYALSSNEGIMAPSGIISELGLKTEARVAEFGYVSRIDELRMAKDISVYEKTGEKGDSLNTYKIPFSYKSFNPVYKGILPSHMEERFTKEFPLKLSYTSIRTYFECPFHFYLDRVLGLNTYESTTATRLGTYCHAVLEDSYLPDFDFDKSLVFHKTEGLKELNPSDFAKDEFYFDQMKPVLSHLISFNREREGRGKMSSNARELNIEINKENVTFLGFIDKLLYKETDTDVYAVIIDYKSGKDVISLDNVSDGFHLQLPSYMYLLRNYPSFKDKKIHIIGIYLQKVNKISLTNDKDMESQMNQGFRLEGYSIKDQGLLSWFDPMYFSSDYIKSMMRLKNGDFGKYSKVIDEDEEEKLIRIVEEKIEAVKNAVFSADFKIAPKKILGRDQSCTFCKYKDICFKRPKDYINLKEDKFQKEDE